MMTNPQPEPDVSNRRDQSPSETDSTDSAAPSSSPLPEHSQQHGLENDAPSPAHLPVAQSAPVKLSDPVKRSDPAGQPDSADVVAQASTAFDGANSGAEESVAPSVDRSDQTPLPLLVPGRVRSDQPVAVVTGAARRVGREIALAMAARGLAVVVHHGTSTVEANVLVHRIRNQGGTAIAVSADLRDPRTAAMTVFEAAAELGEVTTLINSAAVFQERALPWVDLYHCHVHLSVNLLAPIFLAQQFIRQLGEGQRGHIVNILDWRGQRPGSDHLVYTSTKAALASVTRSLAQQLAPLIQVNGIAPGAILPPEDRSNWHEQRAISSIPLRRTGSPNELVKAIHFLLDSDFVTGEILNVTGGEEL